MGPDVDRLVVTGTKRCTSLAAGGVVDAVASLNIFIINLDSF